MTKRQAIERRFRTHDGVDLYYQHWPAQTKRQGAVLLFHRGHEHSARMAHLVDELELPEFEFFAWDARGHGHSPGPRGYSPSFATSVRDVEGFKEWVKTQHQCAEEDMYVTAQSVGAVLISTWAHDYAPKIRGMTLASPAFKVKLYVPFARAGLALMHKLRGLFYVNSYVKPKLLTHDPVRIASYQTDPLISRAIAVNILLDLYRVSDRVVRDAQAIHVPTLLLSSGADWVVHQRPQDEFFSRLGSDDKQKHVLEGFYHDTLGERDRAPAVGLIRTHIKRVFAQAPQRKDLRTEHLDSPSQREAQTLATALPALSPRGIYWAATRANLRLGGFLSQGIRLGHETGFDSGSTLDYVYRNQAAGAPVVGSMVDRVYLNSIGWRGIRIRKHHIEELIAIAVVALKRAQRPVHVLDIAAGHGRYVLEGLLPLVGSVDSITLRDYSEINVREGSRLIHEKNLEHVAQFVQADAFDEQGLSQITPQPTLALVSGLYELFGDNSMIQRSLSGLARATSAGAYLVYTNQPWHPQLELIARALTSHRSNQAWVMRRRSQAEMDQLVHDAGFEKCAQRIDEHGIFTVSLAVRR